MNDPINPPGETANTATTKVRAQRTFENRSLGRIIRAGEVFEAEAGYAKDLERNGLVSTDLTLDPEKPQRTQALPGAPKTLTSGSIAGNAGAGQQSPSSAAGQAAGSIAGNAGAGQQSPSSAAGQAAPKPTVTPPANGPKRL